MNLFVSRSAARLYLYLLLITVVSGVFLRVFRVVLNFSNTINETEIWDEHSDGTKYILLWDDLYLVWHQNRSVFPKTNCPVNNCMFFMNDERFSDCPAFFDAIIFPSKNLTRKVIPKIRNERQIYVFASLESPRTAPICDRYTDNFFNWTLTYRLDSHTPWTYFSVRNSSGYIVAPSLDVIWDTSYLNYSTSINPALKLILSAKTRAVAWIVSSCPINESTENYLRPLQTVLLYFSLKIDVYGECSEKSCPDNDCSTLIKEKYFFSIAFENSVNEDYVTEKVLYGYENLAVPIVKGGAKYSRFLPPGSYVDAKNYNPFGLALVIYNSMRNHRNYEQYFKWKTHYTIDSSPADYHPLCDLCAALHIDYTKNAPAIKNFMKWWMGNNGMKWCLPEQFHYDAWNKKSNLTVFAKNVYLDLYRNFQPIHLTKIIPANASVT